MKVLTLYSPRDIDIFRIWERSWRKRGWRPGLIAPKEVQRYPSVRAAAKARHCKLICTPHLINFGLRRPRKTPAKLSFTRFGSRGWLTAPLVRFPDNFSEAQILNCGRAL